MRYFANPSTQKVRDAMLTRTDLGAILTPAQGNKIPDGIAWCADNGAFGKDFPGEAKWFAWLAALPYNKALCDFAVAPDVVGDAAATLARSLPWLPKIRALGYPAAFVIQNGAESTPIPWDSFDVLFIGAVPECLHCSYTRPARAFKQKRCPHCARRLTEWKLGRHARAFSAEARRRGKRVHMGRVNSFRRIKIASMTDCDSADGTYVSRGPDINLPRVLDWLDDVNHHSLFGGVA